MNISLTAELEKFVQDKVTGGMYTSASEVIRESLRLMHTYEGIQRKRIDDLNSAIAVGMDQFHNNQYIEGSVSRAKMKQKIDHLTRGK